MSAVDDGESEVLVGVLFHGWVKTEGRGVSTQLGGRC